MGKKMIFLSSVNENFWAKNVKSESYVKIIRGAKVRLSYVLGQKSEK